MTKYGCLSNHLDQSQNESLRNEPKQSNTREQIAICQQAEQPQGFQPPERRNEQWTVDPFWEVDRPQRQQPQPEDQPGPSSRQTQHTPMEEGEIGSETDQDLLVPGSQLGQIRGRQERSVYKIGPRTESGRRTEKLGD